MLIRFKISEGARKRMRESSSKWPLEWRKAVKVMTKLDDESVLRDNSAPRWPGNKIVYLLYLVVYILIEFSATRVVLGSQAFISLWNLGKGSRSASNIVSLITPIGVGLLLIPVFLTAWPLLALWVIVAGTFSAARQRIKGTLAKAQGKNKAKKVWAELDGADLNEDEVPDEGHGNNDEIETEGRKIGRKVRQEAEEKVRKRERREKKRLQERISLLINPLELLDPKNITEAFNEADKSGEDESTEEHQVEDEEEEDDLEGDDRNSVESAYSEYLEKLKSQTAAGETAASEKHKAGFWSKIKSRFKRRETTETFDSEIQRVTLSGGGYSE